MSKQLTIIREVKKQQEDGLSNDENDLKNQLKKFDKMIQQTKLNSYNKKLVYYQKNRYSIQNMKAKQEQDDSMKEDYDKQIYMHGSQFNAQHLQNYLKYSKYSNMSNYMNVTNHQDSSLFNTELNCYQNEEQATQKSFMQESRLEFSKMEEINQINNQLSIRNEKTDQSKSKIKNNASFFFKNRNYRDDIVNESKFQIREYDMNNMNSLNIIDQKQKEQIIKNQKQLEKSGYYNQYYSQRETDFDLDKLNFSKDRLMDQKTEYQTLKQEREKYKQWLDDTRNKNKRLKQLKNRYQTGIIGLENPLVDDSVYKSHNILQLDHKVVNKKANNYQNVRKYWDTDRSLLVESCKSDKNKISQEWKNKKRVNEQFVQQNKNTFSQIIPNGQPVVVKQRVNQTSVSKIQFY